MEQERPDEQTLPFAESHPWLFPAGDKDGTDEVDEVIRYTLDELRLA